MKKNTIEHKNEWMRLMNMIQGMKVMVIETKFQDFLNFLMKFQIF